MFDTYTQFYDETTTPDSEKATVLNNFFSSCFN